MTNPEKNCTFAATQAHARAEANVLEAGYAPAHRTYESLGIALTCASAVWFITRLLHCSPVAPPVALFAAVLGLLSADFVSGFFHWLFDTWGSVRTPVVGPLAIRTFRHHHVAPSAMTSHDFVETNGHNFALALVPLTLGLMLVQPRVESHAWARTFFGIYLGSFAFFVACTSQIHKWAHLARPPSWVRVLQRIHLLLPPQHHAKHHVAPHHRYYCVTVGWLNAPLHHVRFFECLEYLVQALTGATPRSRL
jgi:plasmanylethanolamine desaturase